MLPSIDPTETAAWQKLTAHYLIMQATPMRELFAEDMDRFTKFSKTFEDVLVDYSKNIINEETIAALIQLAEECELGEAIHAMFQGDKINKTENRSVLHVALRNRSNSPFLADGENVMPQVNAVLDQMKKF